jgi:hypothetical protein
VVPHPLGRTSNIAARYFEGAEIEGPAARHRWLNQRRNVMTGNVMTAKSEVLDVRELSPEELSPESGWPGDCSSFEVVGLQDIPPAILLVLPGVGYGASADSLIGARIAGSSFSGEFTRARL